MMLKGPAKRFYRAIAFILAVVFTWYDISWGGTVAEDIAAASQTKSGLMAPIDLAGSQSAAQSAIDTKNLIENYSATDDEPKALESEPVEPIYTYYASGRISSMTLNVPDAKGMIYYHYKNEDWQAQGYGRVDRSRRAEDLNGELSYTYTYNTDSTGRLKTMKSFSAANCTTLIATYTYYNDEANRMAGRTLVTADSQGMIYYHYKNEDWQGRGYGRMDQSKLSTVNSQGEMSFKYTYNTDAAGRLKTKTSYATSSFGTLLATYTYSNTETNHLAAKAAYCYVKDAAGLDQRKTRQSLTYDPTGTIAVKEYNYTYFGEDPASYPGNLFLASKTYVTRSATTGKVATIIDYSYSSAESGHYTTSCQYRVNLDGTKGKQWKVIEYVYIGTTAKTSRIGTYGSDGITLLKDESWTYYSASVISSHKVIDARARTITEESFDVSGSMISKTVTITGDDLTQVYEYDGKSGLIVKYTEKRPAGGEYGSAHRIVELGDFYQGDQSLPGYEYTYIYDGFTTTFVQRIEYAYFPNRNVHKKTIIRTPSEPVQTYEYDVFGSLVAMAASNGFIFFYVDECASKLLRQINPDLSCAEYFYDSAGVCAGHREYRPNGDISVYDSTGAVVYSYVYQDPQTEPQGQMSVTTAAGDILNYVDGNIVSVIRKSDGMKITDIELDVNGGIKNAYLTYSNGMSGVVYNGELLQTKDPGGNFMRYRDGMIATRYSLSAGISSYAYIAGLNGEGGKTRIWTDDAVCIYDVAGAPIAFSRVDGTVIEYDAGFIKSIADASGIVNIYNIIKDANPRSELIGDPSDGSVPAIVYYGLDGSISGAFSRSGELMSFEDNLPISLSGMGVTTYYDYDLDQFGNIAAVEVDRDGIKRIYDELGNLKSLALEGYTSIDYGEDGFPQEIRKNDGTTLSDLVFRQDGGLDGALVSYPDGSMALYSDGDLLKIIAASGDETLYEDGKIRTVTTEDGSVYRWSYNGVNIIITDEMREENRTYLDGRLIRTEGISDSSLATRYLYDGISGSLVRSEICRDNEVLYTYTYTYESGLTLIHDVDGNTQAYTKDKKLSYIIDSMGRKYSYTYVGKQEGYIEVYFPSGVKARYDYEGSIIDITEYDGSIIKDIVLADGGTIKGFTHTKDGEIIKVADGLVIEVLSPDGTDTMYYENGFVKSVKTPMGELSEYLYYVGDSKQFSGASTFLNGDIDRLNIYNSDNTTYLALSNSSLEFGNGADGAKRISSNETLQAGTYNFTSLFIDAGKTLTVSPGAVIKCLGAVEIRGSIFCGGGLTIYAPEVNISSTGVVTGAVDIKCITINNSGLITGNACMSGTIISGPEAMRDDNFDGVAAYLDISQSPQSYASTITFPSCSITSLKFRGDGSGTASNGAGYMAIYLRIAGVWTPVYSISSSGAWASYSTGNPEVLTAGWSDVSGMQMYSATTPSGGAYARLSQYEMQAIIGAPKIEYVNGSPGDIKPAPASANPTQPSYPSSGIFESEVIELNALELGTISWSQELPQGTNITFQTRTGDNLVPDETWSEWSGEMTGQENVAINSSKARYMQYRVILHTLDARYTPLLKVGDGKSLGISFSRAPTGGDELSSIYRTTVLKNGVTSAYDANGFLVWEKDANGNISSYDPPLSTSNITLGNLIYDYSHVKSDEIDITNCILNDTQKEVYLKDSIIISELTAIRSIDGTIAEYCQGKLSRMTMADGAVLTDISFDSNNNAESFNYQKGGNYYVVKYGKISEVTMSSGEHVKYYENGMKKSSETDVSKKEYEYGTETTQTYDTTSALLGGEAADTSYRTHDNITYLELSQNSLKFGTGADGVKLVTTNETLGPGTYNFTSLFIDAGKTLTVSPGAVIKCLGAVEIRGSIFCGGGLTIYAPEVNISSTGVVTGAVDIKCITINNSGLITGNACMSGTIISGPEAMRDDNFNQEAVNTGISQSPQSYASAITFPSASISSIKFHGEGWGTASNGTGYMVMYLRIAGVWTAVYSISGSGPSGGYSSGNPAVISTGWSDVTGIQMYSVTTPSGGAYAGIYQYEMQAIIGTPKIEYVNGSLGSVKPIPSSITPTQPNYPSSGTFESDVIELNALELGTISWSQELPQGTNITFQTRTGDTLVPDETWSQWSREMTEPAGSVIESAPKKYLQYKINLSTTDSLVTPRVVLDPTNGISIGYTMFSDNVQDTYVKVKENGVTSSYNNRGVLIWTEDINGSRTYYDPADPQAAIDLSDLVFDPSYQNGLKEDIPSCKLSDAQKVITVYDKGNDIPVETVTAGQTITYFDRGYATKVVDKDGVLQVQYSYDADMNVTKVEFLDARYKLQANYEKAVSEIVTEKDAALAKLEASGEMARLDIAAKVANINMQISDERHRLTLEMAKYPPNIYDLSGFTAAFAEVDSYEAKLYDQESAAYADLDAQLAAARLRIEEDSQTAMQELIDNDYNKILADIVQKESAPIVYQYYRKVLGRDPGNDDLLYWTNAAKTTFRPVTAAEITQYLEGLPEYADRAARKANIISSIAAFFTQYLESSDADKQAILTSLGVSPDDAALITQDDVDMIISWLTGQSLHFGDSAFETIISMLKNSGVNKSFEDIGKDALKIDILTGNITKETTGDLLISMYAMRKTASLYGLTLSAQKITYADLKDQVSRGSVIIHVDGKHFVTVVSIDDAKGTVKYIDPTVGRVGQEIEVTSAKLLEMWKGYALSKEAPADPAKTLNATQEKNIRGSGWWEDFWRGIVHFFQKIVAPVGAMLMMLWPVNPVLGGIGTVLAALNVVVQTVSFVVRTGTLMDIAWAAITAIGSAIGSVVLPSIYEAVGNVFSSIATNIFTPLKEAFTSVMPVFNILSTTVKDIATGIGHIVSFGTAQAAVEAVIGTNIITQGVSLGSSFLFKSMGLDPTLADIGSALFSGAVCGFANPDIGIVGGILRSGSIVGVQELGAAVGLDPSITQLGAMMAGSLVGGALSINGHQLSYEYLMESIAPNIASECAYIGIAEVGELLGLDPRISYLAGVGIRSTINAGLTHEFMPDEIWGSVTQGLLQGVTNIGLNFATEELGISPLLANIGFSAISGAINAGIQVATGGSQDVFQSLFQTYKDNALTFLGYGDPSNAWQQAAYISQILDFSDIVQERGLVEALNTYGAGFFNAVAVNNIVQSGMSIGQYFASKLDAGQYTTKVLNDGTEVKVVTVEDNQSNPVFDTFFKQQGEGESRYWDLIGGEEYAGGNSYLGWGDFGVDAYGKLGYTDAEIYAMFDSDIQYQRIMNGYQTYAEIKDWEGNTLLIIEPTAGESYNIYDSYGDYVDAKIEEYSRAVNITLTGGYVSYCNSSYDSSYLFEGDIERLSEYGFTVEDLYGAQLSFTTSADGTVSRTLYWSNREQAENIWSKATQAGIWANVQERFDNAHRWLGFRTNSEIQAHLLLEGERLQTMGETGDIIFVNGKGWQAEWTKNITQGPSNHVGMLYIDSNGEKWVLEMLDKTGLQKISLSEFIQRQEQQGNDIVVGRRDFINGTEISNVVETYLVNPDTGEPKALPYNWFNLVGLNSDAEDRFICSALVEYVYRKAGKPIFIQYQRQYSPVDVYNEIDKIGTKY